jgi:hypothetical protein
MVMGDADQGGDVRALGEIVGEEGAGVDFGAAPRLARAISATAGRSKRVSLRPGCFCATAARKVPLLPPTSIRCWWRLKS